MQSGFSVAVLLFGALIAEKQTGRFSSGSELATAMNATSKNHVVSLAYPTTDVIENCPSDFIGNTRSYNFSILQGL